MNPIDIIKSVLGVILLAGAAYLTWDYVGCKQELAIIKTASAQAVKDNEKLLEVEHEKYQQAEIALNTLLDTPIPGVWLPVCGQTPASAGSEARVEANRILLAETERVLAEDRSRTKGIIGEAEHELNGCRVVKAWALTQSP